MTTKEKKEVWVIAVHKEGTLSPVAVTAKSDDVQKIAEAFKIFGRVILWKVMELHPHPLKEEPIEGSQ